MKSTMSMRDKKLLVGMFIVVIIVAIGYWGILPQIKACKELDEKLEKEEETKEINEVKLINVGAIQIQADEYEDEIAQMKDEFYQILTSSQIDRMMTEMATDNGLDIYELNFSMPKVPTERLAYENSLLYYTQLDMMADYKKSDDDDEDEVEKDLEDLGLTDEKDDSSNSKSKKNKKTVEDINDEVFGEEPGGYRPNTEIYAVPVTMTVGGNTSNLNSFIKDIINSDKRILMVGYSWGTYRQLSKNNLEEDSTGTDDSVKIITKKSLTVKLEIYMCDTSDVATETDAAEE